MKKLVCLTSLVLLFSAITAQKFYKKTKAANQWVNQQFNKMNEDERIAQLMIIRAHSNLGKDHTDAVTALIRKYNIGGLCFFQGGPIRQAHLTNYYQSIAKTPLMIAIDGEWGLGMRLDSVINFPRQLMMGAISDKKLIYAFGKAVGAQCKRLGIHVNYAPDVDVNNNPANPVINDRSFGEDKYKVAMYGVAYMKGMQDMGIMACAKHFPGHGDVSVDSHKDLPLITKSREQLDNLELYPFREMINAGVGSVMIAHLSIPAIDTTTNLPTSLSAKNVTGILRNELKYNGIAFTDALEMQGVAKYFPQGEASVQSLIAGNDMLCLPGDVAESIEKVKTAIQEGKLTWSDLNTRVKKVLLAKYHLGLNKKKKIKTHNILKDLNKHTVQIKKSIARQAITLLQKNPAPITPAPNTKIAYVGIGSQITNAFADRMKKDYNADIFMFGSEDNQAKADSIWQAIQEYPSIIAGLHNYSRRPANRFGINPSGLALLQKLQNKNVVNFMFGNPYAIQYLCDASTIVACYEDDEITQTTAADLLQGRIAPKGKLPVTVCEQHPFGSGTVYNITLPYADAEETGFAKNSMNKIDSIAQKAIENGATPGCVVLVARNGKIVHHQAYGYTDYTKTKRMQKDMVFDLASVTKTTATTLAIMKLYDEKKIDLSKKLGDYLTWTKKSDKGKLRIVDLLLHQGGLTPFIPFYKELIDTLSGRPFEGYFSQTPSVTYTHRVAENLFLRNDWHDTLYKRILRSKLSEKGKYVYSDNDFIFLGKLVEKISGKALDKYVQDALYQPLNLSVTGFQPRKTISLNNIVPTEIEKHFRQQQLHGDVHDEGAALLGGIAGHAGLFSNAYELAQIYQLLLNNGALNGVRLFKPATIKKFTSYSSTVSRRGLGFDKPEKDNASRKEPYPASGVSPAAFGHTGFTGTCVWADPKENLIYIFLSNRVNPSRSNNKLGQMNVRSNIQEAIYGAIGK